MSREDKIREKRRLARLQKSQKEKEKTDKELEDMLADEKALFEDIDVEEQEVETVNKDYGEMPMSSSPPATSFAELDKYKEMEERAEKVRETSYEVRELISNILYYSELSPVEKAKAIQNVGSEFGARVQNVISQDVTEMDKTLDNMDLLYLKSILATDTRRQGVIGKLTDWLQKDKEGSKGNVRYQLKETISAMEKGEVVDNVEQLIEMAHKIGIGTMDVEKSAIIVEKAVDGKWRAVMFPSNNRIDWDNDIISESAHLDYVEWVNKNMDCAPVFMTKHIPGTARENPVDFVGYESGFLIMSAPLTEKEAAGLLRAQELCDLGMSHGSLVLERDPQDQRVVTKYRTVEVTDCPLETAANPFTSIGLITKEADMAVDTKKYLTAILGSEEKAQKFLDKAGIKQKELDAAEIPSKEVKPEETLAIPDTAPKSLTMEQVIEQVSKEFGFAELSTQFAELTEKASKVDVLEQLVKELAAKKEDELAEMIQPKAAKGFSWMSARASQKTETILKEDDKEDEKLAEAKPKLGWLSEVTKTAPIQEV